LSAREIARATRTVTGEVRADLKRLLPRAERALSPGQGKPAEWVLTQELRKYLYREGGAAFDQAAMLRAFEQDAENVKMPRRLLRRATGALFTVLAALLCAGLFWLLAVLMEG
jgi:hypothetical protein